MRTQPVKTKKPKTKSDSKIILEKSVEESAPSLKRSRSSFESIASPSTLLAVPSITSSKQWRGWTDKNENAAALTNASDARLITGEITHETEMDVSLRSTTLEGLANAQDQIFLLSQRVKQLEELVNLKRDLDRKPLESGIKKIWGIVKRPDSKDFGKVFTCLRGSNGKDVPKTYKALNGSITEYATVKSGVKKLGDKLKKWTAWFAKEDDSLVLGSYSEEIVDGEETASTEEM